MLSCLLSSHLILFLVQTGLPTLETNWIYLFSRSTFVVKYENHESCYTFKFKHADGTFCLQK